MGEQGSELSTRQPIDWGFSQGWFQGQVASLHLHRALGYRIALYSV